MLFYVQSYFSFQWKKRQSGRRTGTIDTQETNKAKWRRDPKQENTILHRQFSHDKKHLRLYASQNWDNNYSTRRRKPTRPCGILTRLINELWRMEKRKKERWECYSSLLQECKATFCQKFRKSNPAILKLFGPRPPFPNKWKDKISNIKKQLQFFYSSVGRVLLFIWTLKVEFKVLFWTTIIGFTDRWTRRVGTRTEHVTN